MVSVRLNDAQRLLLQVQTTAEDEAFMADLLGEVDANILPARAPTKKSVKSENRRKVRILSPPLTQERQRPKYQVPGPELVDAR